MDGGTCSHGLFQWRLPMMHIDKYQVLSQIGLVLWKIAQFVIAWVLVFLFTYLYIPYPGEKEEYTREEVITFADEIFEKPDVEIGQAMAFFDEKGASCWFLEKGEDGFYANCRFMLVVGFYSMPESISVMFRKIEGQELLNYEISKEFGGVIDKEDY
jgi:hypothetical protein